MVSPSVPIWEVDQHVFPAGVILMTEDKRRHTGVIALPHIDTKANVEAL